MSSCVTERRVRMKQARVPLGGLPTWMFVGQAWIVRSSWASTSQVCHAQVTHQPFSADNILKPPKEPREMLVLTRKGPVPAQQDPVLARDLGGDLFVDKEHAAIQPQPAPPVLTHHVFLRESSVAWNKVSSP